VLAAGIAVYVIRRVVTSRGPESQGAIHRNSSNR
jgi:hypothetical protein